jgi:hypothetical protein
MDLSALKDQPEPHITKEYLAMTLVASWLGAADSTLGQAEAFEPGNAFEAALIRLRKCRRIWKISKEAYFEDIDDGLEVHVYKRSWL